MKKIIILVLIFLTLILGVSYLVIQPSLALDPLQKTNLSYLKYEEDDDFLYQRIYDFILENDDLLIGLSSYNMSNYLDENYDYMVKVAVNYVIDHKDDYDNIQNNMISLDEVYKITDYFFDKRDFYVNDVSDGMVKLDLYNKRFKLDISDMNIISDTDSEVLVLVSYDNDCAISSFKFSFGRDDDKLYVRNIEVVS